MKRSLLPLLLLLLSQPVFAFKLSPMIANFAPSGSEATQNFILENTGAEKVSVVLEMFHRFTDMDGKETRTPTDEFMVNPLQLTLAPREKRVVRVTWTGSRQPDHELNYRLIVSELPTGPDQRKRLSDVKFLMQYVASLYVTPANTQAKLSVESFKILSDGRGELVLKNSGLAHQMLKGAKIVLRTDLKSEVEKPVEIEAAKIDELSSENILSLSSRRFYLPLPQATVRAEKANPGSVKAEIIL